MIAFKKVRDRYGWLSNMSQHPVQGYRTAEALFQALRFDPKDTDIIEAIKAEKSPMGAKMVAKKNSHRMVVTPRSETDLHIMRTVLRAKVMAHPELVKALLDTGEQEIIEDVTARPNESGLFWGAALQFSGKWEWVGENTLGNMWMSLRSALRYEEAEKGWKNHLTQTLP